MSVHGKFTAQERRVFSGRQNVSAPPEAVFPLLCPVREYDWIPDWDCRLLYTESGVAEDGCVFQTDRPSDGGLDTWVVSRYEPPARIAFVRVNALRAMQYDIQLEPVGDGATRLTWTQVVTALCNDGNRHVRSLRDSDFATSIAKMETLLNAYLDATPSEAGA